MYVKLWWTRKTDIQHGIWYGISVRYTALLAFYAIVVSHRTCGEDYEGEDWDRLHESRVSHLVICTCTLIQVMGRPPTNRRHSTVLRFEWVVVGEGNHKDCLVNGSWAVGSKWETSYRWRQTENHCPNFWWLPLEVMNFAKRPKLHRWEQEGPLIIEPWALWDGRDIHPLPMMETLWICMWSLVDVRLHDILMFHLVQHAHVMWNYTNSNRIKLKGVYS